MKDLVLQAQEFRPGIGKELEKRGLITFLHHPENGIRGSLKKDYFKGEDFVADKHGFHSVTITYTEIFLSSHPERQNEIVFLWDAEKHFKPLYFVFALHKRPEYLSRFERGRISVDDYLAVRFPYNDPCFSSFIIWNGTVHCELTDNVRPGKLYPSFFVLEPQQLTVNYTKEKERGINLLLQVNG